MNKKYLLPIFLVVAVDVLGLTIVLPLLPFYAQHFGATPLEVGLVISSYAIFQLISGPMLGALSDHHGRRPVLLFSQIGTFVGFIILARANALWMVFLSRIIDGATAGNLSVAQAYMADVTEPKDRAKAFALIGIAFGLGFFVGPWISGELSVHGIEYPIWAAAALSLTSVCLTFFMLKEPEKHVDTTKERRLGFLDWKVYRSHFSNPDLAKYLFQFACFTFAFSIFFSGFPLFAERRFMIDGHYFGTREVGRVYAYSGFLGIIIQGGFVGRAVRKFGEVNVAIFGFISAAAGYFILGFAYSIPLLVLSSTVAAFGSSTIRPSLTALISHNAPRGEQGVLMGLTQSINSISQIICPVIAGFMIGHEFLTPWALLSGAISLAGLALLMSMKSNSASLVT